LDRIMLQLQSCSPNIFLSSDVEERVVFVACRMYHAVAAAAAAARRLS
jgi:hypothetical protein